jgi:tRNA A-37 threonylcarbamoyl transferase component Bud32
MSKLMQTTHEKTMSGAVFCYDPDVITQADPQIFDPEWHAGRSGITGQSIGRGCAYFLELDGHALVLRPFRRGGLIGRLIKDGYLRVGASASRGFREYHLLAWMRAQGLPVPHPVAAHYKPVGLWYRADLITKRIAHSRPLADVIAEVALPDATWAQIGAVVRQMHDLGVDHTDLNCRNILIDDAHKIWLIDFDKCARRAAGSWTTGNLDRLKRSLEKERAKAPLHWAEANWAALTTGYDTA